MRSVIPRILGTGYAVPPKIRTNDDPIFDWLKRHPPPNNPFQGYDKRHVLSKGETLTSIMVAAARNALKGAGVSPGDVDLLVGCASLSPYGTPNELSLVHRKLGLSESAWVVALNNEFSNFNAGLCFADGLIRAGRIKNALVAVGCNWTRHVSYRTVQSVSAADGAGAAVMGLSSDRDLYALIDQETITQTQYYGSMFMQGVERRYRGRPLWTDPFFQITPEGLKGFGAFGAQTAPNAVIGILERRRIPASAIGLIAHQASSTLYAAWVKAIGLKSSQLLQTIRQFANMTLANNAVNLAYAGMRRRIPFDSLVLLSLGPDMHANALLLSRG
jgi:3-oxoacyl-[acyl-carrier-protein] synthase III